MSMTTDRGKRTEGRISGWHVLAAMLGFFAVIVAVDATMMYKALSTFGGVDNDNAYRDGLAYNSRIASAERQTALGWQDKIEAFSNPAKLRVALADKESRPLSGVRVETHLARPATSRFDVTLAMSEVAPGVFEAAVATGDDDAGAWIADVRVFEAGSAAPVYRTRRRVWLNP